MYDIEKYDQAVDVADAIRALENDPDAVVISGGSDVLIKIREGKLAEAQVHGGMSMGLGYGLSEQLLFDAKGRPLNDNLLDYKLPTAMDTPDLHVEFVEINDPTGPFGNKALGEPPAIPVAPAIRNAVLNATGVAVDSLPMDPQKMVAHFKAAGLI